MGRVITGMELRYNAKEKCFVITSFHKEDSWEGSSSGARIYEVGNFYVQTNWGNPKPVKVFTSKQEMIDSIKKIGDQFGFEPVIIE